MKLSKNRNFILTALGKFVSDFGNIVYNFAQSFYILQFSDNNALLQGVFLAVCGIVFGVTTLLGGVLSDRYNRAKIMYICDFAKGGLFLLFAVAAALIPEKSALLVLVFVVGVITNAIAGIFSPAGTSLLPMIVEKEQLQQANSYFSLMTSSESIVGAVVAAILFQILSLPLMALGTGVVYIMSGISEVFIRYDYVKKEEKLSFNGVFSDIGSGCSYILRMKPLLALIVAVLFVNFFLSPVFANFLPFFVETEMASHPYFLKELVSPESFTSIVGILEGIGMIVMSIIMSRYSFEERNAHKRLRVSLVGLSMVLLAMAFGYHFCVRSGASLNLFLLILIVQSPIVGILIANTNIPTATAVEVITDPNMLGKVSACLDVGAQALVPLSSFLAGIVLNAFPAGTLLFICAGGFILASLYASFNKNLEGI